MDTKKLYPLTPEEKQANDNAILKMLGWELTPKQTKDGWTNPVPTYLEIEREQFYDNKNTACFQDRINWLIIAVAYINNESAALSRHALNLKESINWHTVRNNVDAAYRDVAEYAMKFNNS